VLEWGHRAWLVLLWDRRQAFLLISGRRAILLLCSNQGWKEESIRRDATRSDIYPSNRDLKYLVVFFIVDVKVRFSLFDCNGEDLCLS
jgi:hypothetical protein